MNNKQISSFLSKVLTFAIKEWNHILRDRRSFLLTLIFPAFIVVFLGYAVTLDVNRVRIAVLDEDGVAGRQLEKKLEGSTTFEVVQVPNLPEGIELLKEGHVQAILQVPRAFSKNLFFTGKSIISLIVDGSDNNAARIIMGYLADFAGKGFYAVRHSPPRKTTVKYLFNPALDTRLFFVPGIIAIFIFMMAVAMTALSIVREKEQGTFENILVTPVRPIHILTGKVIPYLLIGFVNFFTGILCAYLFFGFHVYGSWVAIAIIALLFVACGVCLGMLLSTLTKSSLVAWLLSFILTFLPSVILSDFVFPTRSMPGVITAVSWLVPTKYFMHLLRDISMKGAPLDQLLHYVLPLMGFTFIFMLVATRRMKRAHAW